MLVADWPISSILHRQIGNKERHIEVYALCSPKAAVFNGIPVAVIGHIQAFISVSDNQQERSDAKHYHGDNDAGHNILRVLKSCRNGERREKEEKCSKDGAEAFHDDMIGFPDMATDFRLNHFVVFFRQGTTPLGLLYHPVSIHQGYFEESRRGAPKSALKNFSGHFV